jgi:outer membrane protein assembly factor BamA
VRASFTVIWLAVIGCGRAAAPQLAPVATPCTEMRVGTVTVVGASRSAVAALAILEGTIDDPARTARILETARQTLQFQGYAHATVSLSRQIACFADLHVAVDLGPKFHIDRIEFQTTDGFPAAERLAVIEDALGTVNTVGGVYIQYRLERALAGLERRYHDAGWLEAKIAPPAAHYDDHGAVTVSIPVDAGPRFRVGAIRARGAGAAARATVLEEIGLEPGAWYDGPTIRNGIARARRKLDRGVELRTSVSSDRGEIELEAVLEARP